MGRVVVILVTGVILIGGITMLSMNRMSASFISRCVDQYNCATAHDNAVSVADITIGCLVRGEEFEEFRDAQVFGSRVSLDTFRLTDELVKVSVHGFVPGKDTATVEAVVDIHAVGAVCDPRATVVVGCDFMTAGQLVIDGRNHNTGGELIPRTGTLAVSTIKKFNRTEFSTIGGTCGEQDYEPKILYTRCLVEEIAVWQNGFPDTPDRVFGGERAGFPEGRLREIAKSGHEGGQYVTDPAKLHWPLVSVTYVELPTGKSWNDVDLRESWGILVVHNAQKTALLKNIKQGTFSGIIIADNINEIDNLIYGTVTLFTQSNTGLGGVGSIIFSREAVEKALTFLQGQYVKPQRIISWYESF